MMEIVIIISSKVNALEFRVAIPVQAKPMTWSKKEEIYPDSCRSVLARDQSLSETRANRAQARSYRGLTALRIRWMASSR